MSNTNYDLDNEYRLDSLGEGVRGKYCGQYQKGTKIIFTDVNYEKNGKLVEERPGSTDTKAQ